MGKKRRSGTKKNRRKSSRSQAPAEHRAPGYWEIASPFAEVPELEFRAALTAAAVDANRSFAEGLSRFDAIASELDPLLILSRLAGYGLLSFDGTTQREWDERNPVFQHHAEILQAFVLRHQYSQGERRVPLPEDDRAVYESVRDLTQAFIDRRLAQAADLNEDLERARSLVVEELRIQAQAIRNPGFPQHIRAVVQRLFAPIDNEFERVYGLRVAVLIEMWFRAKLAVENRMNAHLDRCRTFYSKKTVSSAIAAFCQEFPDIISYEELSARASAETNGIKEVRVMLLYYADSGLPFVYTLGVDEFLGFYNAAAEDIGHSRVDVSTLNAVLARWSLSFGDLKAVNLEHFFLDNPVWYRPLIALDEASYFCPIITIFLGYFFEMVELLISPNAKLKAKYERRRSVYLEEEITAQMREAVPEATILHGVKWTDPTSGIEYENDVVVLFGAHVLVIEAKAGRVHPTAKRGAKDRVESMINRLLVESAEQATRFIEYLSSHPGQHRLSTVSGRFHDFETNADTRFAGLSVLLDDFGVLNHGLRLLKEAGFIDSEFQLAPTITIFHLLSIVDLLKEPVEIMHYFFRRADFERHVNYKGDEMDLLAFYLETGFNIGTIESAEKPLWIWGHSRQLDHWFMSPWSGKRVRKPEPRRTKWFRDMVLRLQDRQPVGWTLMTSILLNVSFEDQMRFEKGLKTTRISTRRFGLGSKAQNMVFLLIGPEHRAEMLVGLALVDPPGYVRRKRLQFAIAQAREILPSGTLLVVGQHIENPTYPYDLIAVPGAPSQPIGVE